MKLKDYLRAKKLSQSQFAALIGVKDATVSRYLSGHRRPEWDVVDRIKAVTGGLVTADDLGSVSPRPLDGVDHAVA